MFEIRIHGLGGEGVVRLSDLIGKTAIRCGKWAHSFPFFGTDIRGAAVKAFTRVDDEPIRTKSYIYEPDIVILTNEILANEEEITAGIKEEGVFLLNSPKSSNEFSRGKYKVIVFNATSLAHDIIGQPIVNTILLGAFLNVTGLLPLEGAVETIYEEFPEKIAELNIAALKAGYNTVGEMKIHG